MERLRGVPLTDLDAIKSITRADPTEVLVNALNTWFGTVMGASSFHADVHAGEGQPWAVSRLFPFGRALIARNLSAGSLVAEDEVLEISKR